MLLMLFLFLIVYSFWLVNYAGFLGFVGDGWQIIGLSWNKTFAQALASITNDFRPVEAIFWIFEFKMLGLNSQWSHFVSLFLLCIGSYFFGLFIYRFVTHDKWIVCTAVLVSFFYPATMRLTFILATDNSRLSAIFFWLAMLVSGSVWLGASKPGFRQLLCLLVSGVLFLFSFLTYENFIFVLFLLPIITLFSVTDHLQVKNFLKCTGFCLFIFILFLIIRSQLLGGGAVKATSMSSLLHYLAGVTELLTYNTAIAFRNMTHVKYLESFYVGLLILLLSFILFCRLSDLKANRRSLLASWAIAVAGVLLSVLPYVLAGYRGSLAPLSNGRIFSSFSYALAISIVYLLKPLSRHKGFSIVKGMMVLLIIGWVADHVSRIDDWQQAARLQGRLYRSLVKQIPEVGKDTSLLLIDFQQYLDEKAVVYEGVRGSLLIPGVIYGDYTIKGYLAYSKEQFQGRAEIATIVSSLGITPRDSALLDASRILLIQQENMEVRLLDQVTSVDDYNFIWKDGKTVVTSNKELLQGRKVDDRFVQEYVNRLPL